jgi:Zn-dependent peptidase ImmA (M78 family)
MSSSAERLLQRFGVERPDQIDLEAIAYDLGALVVYGELDGCEARIVGQGERAIITVNSRAILERQRFSIGHELGHWTEGWRGRGFLCGRDDIADSDPRADAKRDAETQANCFAANLILPDYLFVPAASGKPLTVDAAQALAVDFHASITATAIKLVKRGSHPGMAVCYSRRGREWFVSGHGLPDWFLPLQELHQDTEAFGLLYTDARGKTAVATKRASCWIDRRDAGKHQVKEQSIKVAKDRTLSLIWFVA